MEINFNVVLDDFNFPKILISASVNSSIISIPADINSLIEIIPNSILIEYKNILKNKISNMIQNDQTTFIGPFINNIDLINKYLDSLEGS